MSSNTTTCNACGKEASSNVCGGCRQVSYCSTECLQADWSVHKHVCRETQVRKVLQNLVKREVVFLKNLPDKVKIQITGIVNNRLDVDLTDDMFLQCFSFNHHLQFIHYALVLGGVLPCHYHQCEESYRSPEYAAAFHEQVLVPWFSKHQTFLENRGFRLDIFKNPMTFTITAGYQPQQVFFGQGNCLFRVQPSSLFWNEKHRDSKKVRMAFFPFQNKDGGNMLTETKPLTENTPFELNLEALRILGMSSAVLNHMPLSDRVPLRFTIRNAREFFGGNERVCCSPWLVRFVNDVEAKQAGEYFAVCEKVLAKFGIPIDLDIFMLHATNKSASLSAEGCANLVVAAASGNKDRALDLMEALVRSAMPIKRKEVAAARKLICERSTMG